eukprot:Seg1028.3 transcript_id=Seg1028.3/GoldUCD/mRNA.D3Y31 product="hypothetical protein" protein_id=Seg1028.3/GoldUCD/D3Y31
MLSIKEVAKTPTNRRIFRTISRDNSGESMEPADGEKIFFGYGDGKIGKDAFDTAKQKLTAYFEPQVNKRYDDYVFRKTVQGPEETLDQYHTRLRALADPCEFADLDFELEEQIIIGGSSSRIRKQALRDPKYDLKAILLDGRRDEISKFQSK